MKDVGEHGDDLTTLAEELQNALKTAQGYQETVRAEVSNEQRR